MPTPQPILLISLANSYFPPWIRHCTTHSVFTNVKLTFLARCIRVFGNGLGLTLMVELWALLSPRCLPSLECMIQLSLALQLLGKAHEDSVHFVYRALMLACRNSPLWQGCERCSNVLSSFWPPWLTRTSSIEQHGHHVMCVNPPTVIQGLGTSWWIQTKSAQVSTKSE